MKRIQSSEARPEGEDDFLFSCRMKCCFLKKEKRKSNAVKFRLKVSFFSDCLKPAPDPLKSLTAVFLTFLLSTSQLDDIVLQYLWYTCIYSTAGEERLKKGHCNKQEHRPVEPSACLMETPASVPRAPGALCIYLNCFECLFKLLEKWKNHDYNFFSPSVCYLEGYFTWLSTAVDTTQVNPVIIRKPDRYERHYYLYFCIFTPVWFSENKRIQQLLYSSNSVRLVLPALF